VYYLSNILINSNLIETVRRLIANIRIALRVRIRNGETWALGRQVFFYYLVI
jgi:hypothetical protein